MNHRAKFDAASFILAGEIRNRTNKQTVTDMSTLVYRYVWIINDKLYSILSKSAINL